MSKESAKNNENEYLPLMDSYKEDDPPLVSAESVFRPHPYTRAGLVSRLLFGWVSTLVSFGRTHKLQQDGIGEVCEGIDARAVKAKFEQNWDACKHGEGNVILRALIKTYKAEFFLAFFLNFLFVIWNISLPLFMNKIVEYMQTSREEDGGIIIGVLYVLGFLTMQQIGSLFDLHASFYQELLGNKSSNALRALIYNKTLRLSPATNKEFAQGEIINFIEVDSGKLVEVAQSFPMVARLPIQLIFWVTFLLYYFKYYMLAPIGFIIVYSGLSNIIMSKLVQKFVNSMLKSKDKRMNIITEVINSIKIIKLNSWISFFLDKIAIQRNEELGSVRKKLTTHLFQIYLNWFISPILMISTFAFYFLGGNTMSLGTGFACFQIFDLLHEPMAWIPNFLGIFMSFMVSIKRIQKFLLCPEMNQNLVEYDSKELQHTDVHILIENANFSWGGKRQAKDGDNKDAKASTDSDRTAQTAVANDPEETKQASKPPKAVFSINRTESECFAQTDTALQPDQMEPISEASPDDNVQLKGLSLEIRKAEFVCVIGEVGSGKSSLLSAMLGDMLYFDDEMVSQFGRAHVDEDTRRRINTLSSRFEGVVKFGGSISFVQQVPWIQNMTIRDNVLFGEPFDERKYTQTIEICQLVSDLKLLPGGDLTEIGEKGINLSGGQKARISLARAVYADKDIVLMDDPLSALDSHVKKLIFEGVFLDAMRHKTRVLVTHAVDFLDKADKIIIMEAGRIKHIGTFDKLQHSDEIRHIVETLPHTNFDEEQLEDAIEHAIEEHKIAEKRKVADSYSIVSVEGSHITEDENDEAVEVGLRTYHSFFISKGNWLIYVLVTLFFVGYAYTNAYSTIYFGKWIEHSEDEFWKYFVLTTVQPLSYITCITIIFGLITFSTVRVARILHEGMIAKVCNAPINLYFDKTPSGRILNKFSRDISKIDDTIGHCIWWSLWCYWGGIFNLCIAVINTVWVLVFIPFALGACLVLIVFFIKTFREIKRLESITFSPILNHLSETLNGATTIRCYKKEESVFVHKNYEVINQCANVTFWNIGLRRWFSIRLDIACASIIAFTSIFLVWFKDAADPVLVGSLFIQAIWLSNHFKWGSMLLTEVDGNLMSYARWLKMLDIEQEAPQRIETFTKPNWPNTGKIQFKDYSLKYRPDTELVLQNVSFQINHQEKIGVVGRTGAGKSTLWLALCRIIEARSGSIIIDGIDISKLGLEQLREKITIIPQEPTLFNGTLRFNLDPQNKYSDAELLELTSQAALDKLIARDEKGLDQAIDENGQNLSSGEKQLIWICRAILKQNKVVLMDEATSNIDIKTEQVIQSLIANKFSRASVITIAHRLNTIISSDRVLVLDKGEVREFDSPQVLLQDPDSMFYSYVKCLEQKSHA